MTVLTTKYENKKTASNGMFIFLQALNQEKYLQIFANVFFVKGYTRTALLDSQRQEVILLPNFLAERIQVYEGKKYTEMFSSLNAEDKLVLEEYFVFLEEKEVIFYVSKKLKNSFPRISELFECPKEITNGILQLSEENISFLVSPQNLVGNRR